MARNAVTLERKTVRTKGRTYVYRVLRWVDPDTGKRRAQTLGRADDRRHPSYVTAREAQKLQQLKAAEFEKQPARRRRGLTVGEAVEWYVRAREREGAKPRTLKEDRAAGRMLLTYFPPDTPINRIRRSSTGPSEKTARGFHHELLDGELAARLYRGGHKRHRWSEATARKYLRGVLGLMNRLVRDELIDAHPFAQLGSTTPPVDRAWRHVDRGLALELIGGAPPAWARVIALARFAALSRGDIHALTWSAVDLEAREVRVARVKTGVDQVVPMSPDLTGLVREWLDARSSIRIRDDRVVDLKASTLDNAGPNINRWLARLGAEPYGKPLHTLRKSCITDWAREHPPHVVQAWAGHTSIQTTLKFYTRVTPLDMDRGKAPPEAGNGPAAPLFVEGA